MKQILHRQLEGRGQASTLRILLVWVYPVELATYEEQPLWVVPIYAKITFHYNEVKPLLH